MRLIIVNREASRESGLYFGRSTELRDQQERSKLVAEQLWQGRHDSSLLGQATKVLNQISQYSLVGPIVRALQGNVEEQRMRALLILAYQTGFGDAHHERFLSDVRGRLEPTHGHQILRAEQSPWAHLPFESHCLTLTSQDLSRLGVSLEDISPVLLGQISTQAQFDAVLKADGGNARLHVFNLDVARQVLKRHGGGVIEEGCYVLHPKRDGVIVPFKTYHMDMLKELTRETQVAMGRIGAKKLTIATESGVTFNGSLASAIPLKSGKTSVDASIERHKHVVFEWGSPTYEPDAALQDCVWIQDNAGIMTIVDQRRTSNLTRYEEFSTVDTSFKLAISVMQQFDSAFAWSEKSTYRYEVEFFSRG